MAATSNPQLEAGLLQDESLGLSLVKNASREIRIGFIKKVYGILTTQLLITIMIASVIMKMPKAWFMDNIWLIQLSAVGSLATVCAMSCCPVTRKFPVNYGLLLLFTIFESVLVGAVCTAYSTGVVLMCAGITACIFFGMSIYAWNTKTDFTGFGPYVFGALLALVVFGFSIGIMTTVFGMKCPILNMVYAGCGVLLFTFFIIYDTQLIIGEHGGHKTEFSIDDYIFASLNLYLDIINLFLELLRLFGGSDGNN